MANYVVIPARMASTRLPEKPLVDIAGQPMIVHVARQALKSSAHEVVVAVDHPLVFNTVKDAGLQVVMTREDHTSGSDRVAEVATLYGWSDDDVVVNLQGDEPLLPPSFN